jgi:hypothetical protein
MLPSNGDRVLVSNFRSDADYPVDSGNGRLPYGAAASNNLPLAVTMDLK